MILDPIEIVKQLVAIPSVNPMGGTAPGSEFLETRLTDHLEALFERLGLRHNRQVVEPGRDNLVARLDGDVPAETGGALILFDAHQDTVPVGGMTIEPWTPAIRDGRLYGRGSCDTKGGMAAMLAAISRLAEDRPPKMPSVVMSCSINEEYGFSGAKALTKLWTDEPDPIIPRRPDAAVIAEPTALEVVVAHKGVVRWRCHARGRAAHGSQPEAGDNAIFKMARALTSLQHYQEEVVPRVASHPLCGPATLSVGTIRGGTSVNIVPDLCTVELDRRLPPGENPEQARRHLIDFLANDPRIDFPLEHEPLYMEGLPLSDDANGPLADRLALVASEVVGKCAKVGEPYCTNASFFCQTGVPSVVFGPGSVEQAHTDDEWVSLEQIQQAAEVFYRFVCGWVG